MKKIYQEIREDSFSSFVRHNLKYGTLRENFYNFFVACKGTLPEDPKECKEEIDAAMATYLEYYEAKEEVKKNKELQQLFKKEYIASEAEIRAVVRALRDIKGRFVDKTITPDVANVMRDEIHRSIAILTVAAEKLEHAADSIGD